MAKLILGKKDAQLAEYTRKYLMHDYKPLFESLLDFYKDRTGSEEYKLVQEALSITKSAIDLLPHVFLGYGLHAENIEDLDRLNEILQRIEDLKEYFLNIALVSDTKMQEALESASRMTGVDPKKMKMVQQLSRKAKKNYKRSIKGQQGGRGGKGILSQALSAFGISPSMAVTFAGLSQILGPLLGPLYTAVPIAYGAGVLGYRGIKAVGRGVYGTWQAGRRAVGALGRLRHPRGRPKQGVSPYDIMPNFGLGTEPVAAQRPPRPEPVAPGTPEYNDKVITDKGYIGEQNVRWRNRRTGRFTKAGTPVGKPITESVSWGKPQRRAKPMNKRELHNAALPMFYFFNKLAYKSRWTRDVLRELKRGGGGLLGGKDKKGEKFNLLELFGAGAVFKTLGKAALVLAVKLVAFAVIIGFATKVFTDLYKVGQELKKARTAAHIALTKKSIVTRPQYGRMRGLSYQRISYMDISEREKAKLRAEVDSRLKKMQLKEELVRIEAMPRIWVGPDRYKKSEAMQDFWKRHFPGMKGFLKSNVFAMRGEDYYTKKWVDFEKEIISAPKVPGAPIEFLHRRIKKETREILKEKITPVIGVQQDAATIAIEAMLKRLGIENMNASSFDSKAIESTLKEISGHQEKLLRLQTEGVGGGGDTIAGPYNSTSTLTDDINKDGADSMADR